MAGFDPTKITAEFQIGGTWYDTYGGEALAPRIRGGSGIRITRGFVDQQSSYAATQGNFTLNNRDGLFSPKNPYSPLFGKIKQNLPARLGVQDSAGTWDEYVRMPDTLQQTSQQKIFTADKASLDITGDIDIRIEFSTPYMRLRRQNLAGKWVVSGNQRSWLFEMFQDGTLGLLTSPDGTLGAAVQGLSGVALAENAGRQAVRVTLDVNNGAGGRTYTWYTADTLAGPWTQVATGTTAGTTSIFSSTSAVEAGSANDANGPFSSSKQFAGKIYGFQLYSGIAGTLVADMRPAGQGVGQVSWSDTCASPNTWLFQGSDIRLASDRIRATLELSSLPEEWDVTGTDRFIATTAASLGKRYVSSKGNIGSAIYRLYRNFAGVRGYWPLEDSAGATQAANAADASRPGILTACTFGNATGLDGSAGALTLSSAPNISRAVFNTAFPTTATGTSRILFYYNLATLPASDQVFLTLNLAPGAALRWEFLIGATTIGFRSYDLTGTRTYDSGAILFGTGASPLDQWIGLEMAFTQEGGNIRFETVWHAVGSSTFYTHTLGGSTTAGTLGRGITRAIFGTPDSAFAGAQIAHVVVSDSSTVNLNTAAFANASKAYAGEVAGRRMQRVSGEEGEYFEWDGDLDETLECGPQTPGRFLDVMSAAARVDGGLLGDVRDYKGWRYVTRAALGNRRGLTLDYSLSHLAETPKPITDDRYLVNDFTASRPSGSSARYEANDGRPLNVNDPDDATAPGAGRYEQSGSFAAADDTQLYQLASAQVAIGTYDDFRIPNISVALHRDEISADAMLTSDVIAQDFGAPITLTGLSGAPMAPDDVQLLAFGYTETIGQAGTWGIVSNTVSAGPYQVPVIGGYDVNGEPRLDADFSGHVQVHGDYASGATSIILRTDQDFAAKQVIDSTAYAAEFPVDVMISGERMTMTACTVPSSSALLTALGFESGGVTGWDVSGGSITDSTTFAHGGTHSALLTVSGSPTSAFIRIGSTGQIPVKAGKSYTCGVWVRSGSLLSSVAAAISWYDVNNVQLSSSIGTGTSLASGAWEQRTVTATAPAGAAYARPGSRALSSPANGSLLYSDDFTLTTTGYVYQTATVTRAVNGIAKAQDDGAEMHLADFFDLGLV